MAKKYNIGYTDGVYDLFHTGHLNMIETAKSQCEHLIVGVHGDDVVEGYKHRRPIINEDGRRRIIESVVGVDEAVITRFRDKMKLWEKYHFDVIFIGDDWKGTERWNKFEKELGKIGVDVVYVPYTKGISTTEIRERIMLGDRKKVAITMGDPAGIGAEITVKALAREEVYRQCIPIVIGDRVALEDAIGFCNLKLKLNEIKEPKEARGRLGFVDFIDLGLLKPHGWEYKKNSALCGDASFQYVIKGIELAKAGQVDAVATAPINKESLHMGGHKYSGHTEIFAEYTDTPKYAMLLASGLRSDRKLCVIHVSTHVSLREACDRVKKERVLEVIKLADKGMKLLGFENPRIAVSGLNPHCSEDGLFGHEEAEKIIPAIRAAQELGYDVTGPVPPDTVFVKSMGGESDIVVAMYHDQGHIPLKLCGFAMNPVTKQYTSMSGINCTIGLPVIRTSVDHGTAYGKAGEGRANEESMLDAIYAAVTIANNWQKYGGGI